ncbi:hypothetical protein H4R34_006079 [Dimargaris verticillata]|uniref:Uncharacterized protein n=1 Tax=Dimargaris verticillata TaxID=2761393 RepID=A0A9W8E9N8_9FUNG|nr:hypothetical protein H4R34_006079 [Dimargaris verticillata]
MDWYGGKPRCAGQAIIVAIDSSDLDRLPVAKRELHAMLADESAHGAPVLVYANKQDLPQALSAAQISNALDLVAIKDRQWHIQACSAQTGTGLIEGMEWVSNRIT